MFVEKPPPLSFLRGKLAKTSGDSRKNRSGHLPEHTAALVDNAAFVPRPATPPPSEPMASPENGQ